MMHSSVSSSACIPQSDQGTKQLVLVTLASSHATIVHPWVLRERVQACVLHKMAVCWAEWLIGH